MTTRFLRNPFSLFLLLFFVLVHLCVIPHVASSNERQEKSADNNVEMDENDTDSSKMSSSCQADAAGQCVNTYDEDEEEDEYDEDEEDEEEEEEEEDDEDSGYGDDNDDNDEGDYDEYDDDDDEDDDDEDDEDYEEYVLDTNKHWSEYNRDDFWIKFECPEVFSTERPVPTAATWEFLRESYRIVVGLEKSTIPNEPASKSASFPGLEVVAKQSPGKGRGIFAAQFIPKGTLVWSSIYTARFPDDATYRRFLMSLSPDLACEIMPWSYIEPVMGEDGADKKQNDADDNDNKKDSKNSDNKNYEDQPLYISIDMTIGSLINGAALYDDEEGFDDPSEYEYEGRQIPREWEGYANAGCIPNDEKIGCDGHSDYALRDIYPGEEILMDYGVFCFPDYWWEVGLECNLCEVTTA